MKQPSTFYALLASGMCLVAFLNAFLAVTRISEDSASVVDDRLQAFQTSSSSHISVVPIQKKQVNWTVHVPLDDSLSACLLIKDDNDILDEWLAYHYFALDLRYLVVAIDPSSLTSPISIFDKWRDVLNDDLKIITWNDTDFMPESFLQKGYHIPPRFINTDANRSKWHEGFEDAETVRADKLRISNHRFRQVTFLSACLRHMREQKRTLTMHVDTDEYIVISPSVRKNSPSNTKLPSSIANFIRQIYNDSFRYKQANFPCLSMPRLLFGSVEKTPNEDSSSSSKLAALPGFNYTSFETLRWIYHTDYEDKERNAQPKVIVDVSRVELSDEMFKPKPFSIHRPSKLLCRRIDQMSIPLGYRFPLVVHHYLGTFERYYARNDTRRSARAYNFKAHVQAGRDDWIADWIGGFLQTVGTETAARLLDSHAL